MAPGSGRLSHLGGIQGTVSLHGNEVNVKMNTENNETLNILHEYQGEMDELLKQMGLRLHDFFIQLGLESNQINTENLNLLDIRV